MDVQINEINSVVRAADASTGLSPAALEAIVRHVLDRLRQEQALRDRAAEERRITSGAPEEH